MDSRTAALTAGFFFFTSGFTWGCGGGSFTTAQPPLPTDSGVADTSPPVVSGEQACTDNAHARCTLLAKCSPTLIDTTYVDEGTCETRLKLNCIDQLAAVGTGASPARAEACALALPSETCDQLLDDQPVAACAPPTGTKPNGQICGFPGQCQTGFCAIPYGAACGICDTAPQPGDSCADLTTCGDLLVCVTAVSLCQGFSPPGGPCSKAQFCGAGLSCVGATNAMSGACQPAVEMSGMTCDSAQRTGPGCDRNAQLTCSPASSSCVPLQLAAAGAPCNVGSGQQILCAGAGTCVASAVDAGADGGDAGILQTCQAAATDGLPCDYADGPYCITPARCVVTADAGTSGTCQFVDPTKCQ